MTQYILCSVGLAFVENDRWHVTTRVLYLVACRFFVAYVVSPFMILQTLCCERCAHWNRHIGGIIRDGESVKGVQKEEP